jgi:DNA-binding response OmpR family regulator
MHINHVRDKLTAADVEIETVRGVGYKLVNKQTEDVKGVS